MLESTNTYKIFPSIGVARLGNSPDEYFIGPEAPGVLVNPEGKFKDARGQIKRQAARFRIYELNNSGHVVREVTAHDVRSITWTVHLANKKGSWYTFHNKYDYEKKKRLRNSHIQPDLEPDQRTDLIIDPGPKSISGRNRSGIILTGGKFMGTDVPLGELRTDPMGRLLVLGGRGNSGMVSPYHAIQHFANNDNWYDDISDGVIKAHITFADGRDPVEAMSAWVLVAPPNFAPDLPNIVTLYDVMRELADEKSGLDENVDQTDFHRAIEPILTRISNYRWVNATARRGHGPNTDGSFLTPEVLKQLADPSDAAKTAREAVFQRLRTPFTMASPDVQNTQANERFMPQLSGDGGTAVEGKPLTWMTLLPSQYKRFQQWAEGDFKTGNPLPEPLPFERTPLADQPAALTRAALEACVGGPFYPGIEMTFIAQDPALYREPFRFVESLNPGDITRYMALPWQADFNDCNTNWWPAHRPDDVIPVSEYEAVVGNIAADGTNVDAEYLAQALDNPEPWARNLAQDDPQGYQDMVDYWSELGFVVPKHAPNGETVYLEQERLPLAGMDTRELFYQLMNMDEYPECLPKARAYVEQCLEWAHRFQNHPTHNHLSGDIPDEVKPIKYTEEAFQARVNEIYDELVEAADHYDPATDYAFKTREDVMEYVIQMGPFNMSDGAWLRGISRPGPIDDVRALLLSIQMDELGDGEVSHNHSNIYLDLLHSIGFYPYPIDSRAFAQDPRFLDSAFTIPTFQIAISQFTQSYYPEIMGMTLYLEWSILSAKPTIELLKYHGINPHYYVMHVGIDNAVDGHGQRVVSAIKLYIDQTRTSMGDDAAQALWKRIWTGYVAFGYLGTVGQDIHNKARHKPSLKDRMIDMINEKASYGSRNHGSKMLGDNYINDWFLDPEGFLKELQKAGLVIPGDPDNSPIFRLFSFDTGPMYRVFSPDEIELWEDWIRSLISPPPPPVHHQVSKEMVLLINCLRERQTGSQGHTVKMLPVPDTQLPQTIHWWFTQPTEAFMAALATDTTGWVVSGNPDASLFVTQLLQETTDMGQAFDSVIPGAGGRNGREIAVQWIKAGCPLPPSRPTKTRRLWMHSPHSYYEAHPSGRIFGMGAVH